ncbi:MAG: pantoate--beta-alanine ligase [Rikenellaceae bacterium]
MKITEKVTTLQQELNAASGSVVGFVPTMGALHAGHIALVDRARRECDVVVVSIFVNPTQFNDANDLKHYPRTLEADCKLLEAAGVDVVFAPSVEEIYPQQDDRVFDLAGVDKPMEGASRPGHFNGVAQVVSRLFEIVKPTRSYFGQKDFQQVAVIGAMMRECKTKCEIVTVETVRESSGLALSSRNQLLTAEHKAAAPLIYKALSEAANSVNIDSVGTKSVAEVIEQVCSRIGECELLEVVYFAVVDATTMQSIEEWSQAESIQGCIAVKAGAVRLIDNIKLK